MYPDMVVGLKGLFRAGKMIFGRKVDVTKAWLVRNNLEIEVSEPKRTDEPFRYNESSMYHISDAPLKSDLYEAKTVSCKKSR